jgi:calcineurin-like phosphoesterase family protein
MKVKQKFDKHKVWFISDTHFGHDKIINFCDRPFKFIDEHDEELIKRWNEVVAKDDVVFLLGDFMFGATEEKVKYILSRLNGIIWFILGNHDYQNDLHKEKYVKLFGGRVYDQLDIRVIDEECVDGTQRLFLSHYPCEFWPSRAIHLHGHVHGGPNSKSSEKCIFKPLRYDVGVDNNDYYPISYVDLVEIIDKQKVM